MLPEKSNWKLLPHCSPNPTSSPIVFLRPRRHDVNINYYYIQTSPCTGSRILYTFEKYYLIKKYTFTYLSISIIILEHTIARSPHAPTPPQINDYDTMICTISRFVLLLQKSIVILYSKSIYNLSHLRRVFLFKIDLFFFLSSFI